MKPLTLLRTLALAALTCVLALALTLAYFAGEIVRYSQLRSEHSAQVAIVLGAAAWGNRPSPVYRERLNEAIRLYRQGRVQQLIFTGGTPELAYPSEAAVARAYARQNGVPDEALLVEVKSRTTFENLLQARQLMQDAGVQTSLLVSDPLHMMRAMAIAQELGISAEPAPTDSSRYQSWSQRAKFLWRETWSYAEYQLFLLMHGHGPANAHAGLESAEP